MNFRRKKVQPVARNSAGRNQIIIPFCFSNTPPTASNWRDGIPGKSQTTESLKLFICAKQFGNDGVTIFVESIWYSLTAGWSSGPHLSWKTIPLFAFQFTSNNHCVVFYTYKSPTFRLRLRHSYIPPPPSRRSTLRDWSKPHKSLGSTQNLQQTKKMSVVTFAPFGPAAKKKKIPLRFHFPKGEKGLRANVLGAKSSFFRDYDEFIIREKKKK